MLTAKPYRIASAQSGVEQQVKPYTSAHLPITATLPILGNVFLGPGREAVASLRATRIIDTVRRVGLHKLRFGRPSEQATHGVEESVWPALASMRGDLDRRVVAD